MAVNKGLFWPVMMWCFPVFFFAFQFIFRLWPGLMMQQILTQFSIDASGFGLISAFYYYGYAGMQIPVALLLERFSARKVIFFFACICGLATLLFTYSSNLYLACLSRFLVGAGSAVGFLGVSKVISEWFPALSYTRMVGFSFSIGLLGAIYGGKPISMLTESYPWQNIALILALVSIVIGCVAYGVLRSPSHQKNPVVKQQVFRFSDFKCILARPELWLLAVANLLMVGALEGFSDVWGVPYLMTAYAISKNNAAQLISCLFLGMLFGGPLLAWLSKKLGHYAVIALCGFGLSLAFVLLLWSPHYHGLLLSSLFFSVGLLCCYQVIVFAAGAHFVAARYLGMTIAFLNCVNMLGGSFFHTIIGRLMDTYWTGAVNAEGIRQYSLAAFQTALLVIPISASLGALIVCVLWMRVHRKNKKWC